MIAAFNRWRAKRRQRYDEAVRRRAQDLCSACGHPWSEHAGSGNDCDGMCGECAYEFDHEQRTTTNPGCRLTNQS